MLINNVDCVFKQALPASVGKVDALFLFLCVWVRTGPYPTGAPHIRFMIFVWQVGVCDSVHSEKGPSVAL